MHQFLLHLICYHVLIIEFVIDDGTGEAAAVAADSKRSRKYERNDASFYDIARLQYCAP